MAIQALPAAVTDAIARGWSIIPVDINKKPYFSWKRYQQERATTEQTSQWQNQYNPPAWAVITGSISNLIILDGDGEAGKETFDSLGIDPHRRTGSGGLHCDFEHPGWYVPTLNAKSKKELGQRWPGLDIRGDGGYAVFCGKNTSGEYVWLRTPGELDSLNTLSDNLRDFLGLLNPPQEKRTRSIADVALENALSEAHSGRDDACFRLAQQLHDNNYSRSEAESVCMEFAKRTHTHNKKGQYEPFTEEDARKRVASAYSYAKRDPWSDTATYVPGLDHSSNGNGSKKTNTRLPSVILGGQLRDSRDESLEHLGKSEESQPAIFVQSGRLVQIGRDKEHKAVVMHMGIPEIKNALTKAADFFTLRKVPHTENEYVPKPASPPKEIAEAILALSPSKWPFKPLEAIVETPVIRPDGTILQKPGYDDLTKLYYAPHKDMQACKVPDSPTKRDAQEALAVLQDIIADFPFVDRPDYANMLALLITPIIRPAIKRHVPLALIDAPKQGAGKGLLSDIVAIAATGNSAPIMPAPKSDEEWDKKITSILMTGATIVTLDNLPSRLQSSMLDAVLTADYWVGRILGVSKMVKVPHRATWVATGNNIKVGGDLARRCYRIRIDPQTSKPWTRTEFKYEDLATHVSEHRAEIITAILTLVCAWFVAGCPQDKTIPALGTFTGWARMVGSILSFAGESSFLGNLNKLYDEMDEENAQWALFLQAWLDTFGEKAIPVKALVATLKEEKEDDTAEQDPFENQNESSTGGAKKSTGGALADFLPDYLQTAIKEKPKSFNVVLGKALEKRHETCFGEQNLRLQKVKDTDAKQWLWKVVTGGTGGGYSPSTRENSINEDTNSAQYKDDLNNHPYHPYEESRHNCEYATNQGEKRVDHTEGSVQENTVSDTPPVNSDTPPVNYPMTLPSQVKDLGICLETGVTYVLDLETTGLNPRADKVISIALGTPGNVTVIDVRGFYAASADEQKQWMEALQSLLNRNDVVWAGHNIKFDWSFLAVHFGVRLQNVYDTMLVEKLIHNGEKVSASLLNTASRYGIRITKEERNWFIALDKREEWYQPLPIGQMAYIIQDIEVPHQVIEKQQESIGRFDLERVIALENAALPAVAAMEVHGIVVDAERWKGILATKMGRKEVLEAELTDVLGSALADKAEQDTDGKLFSVRPGNKINLASSDQLVKALAVVGIHVVDAKSETLEEKRDDHAIVSQLLEWKELQKFVSSFGLKLLEKVEPDGRIHANFDQLGARSGRFSCSSPNLQQVPKPKDDDSNLRSCFVAPVDHQLLVADLSNIELRILADLSKDSTMLRFFAEGKDLHSETARLMFNLGPDIDPKTHKINGLKARDIAKTINFGLAYGMGTTGLAASLGVDLETAKELMNSYFATYRGVAKFLDRAGQKGADLGYTRSLSGRRRTFTAKELSPENRWHAVNASKNHPIQGTNADILKRALALLDERLPQGVYIVLTVHDEIVLESPIGLVENAENALKTCMLEACRDFLKSVTIPEIDVLVASHWVKG